MNQSIEGALRDDSARVAGLTVQFIGRAPTDECVRVAHRCIGRARLPQPLTLTVTWGERGNDIDGLRLTFVDGAHVDSAAPGFHTALHEVCEHAVSLQLASPEDRRRWRAAAWQPSDATRTDRATTSH